ncbi:uncharacterized protein LOC125220298 [Salvia hispanica]|uniref:uncharacterized protein LOC125220298 n=1 Tax=Salvia hispanica TaxID=49212 RepID=UPI002009929E|nr:uncharacterized protein LOC125220298 [Salvia hispanica]
MPTSKAKALSFFSPFAVATPVVRSPLSRSRRRQLWTGDEPVPLPSCEDLETAPLSNAAIRRRLRRRPSLPLIPLRRGCCSRAWELLVAASRCCCRRCSICFSDQRRRRRLAALRRCPDRNRCCIVWRICRIDFPLLVREKSWLLPSCTSSGPGFVVWADGLLETGPNLGLEDFEDFDPCNLFH